MHLSTSLNLYLLFSPTLSFSSPASPYTLQSFILSLFYFFPRISFFPFHSTCHFIYLSKCIELFKSLSPLLQTFPFFSAFLSTTQSFILFCHSISSSHFFLSLPFHLSFYSPFKYTLPFSPLYQPFPFLFLSCIFIYLAVFHSLSYRSISLPLVSYSPFPALSSFQSLHV